MSINPNIGKQSTTLILSNRIRNKIIFLFLFIYGFSNLPLFAVDYTNIQFTHLTNEDGLSQSWVRTIEQDYLGFMWFGTNEGLNKFDGYNFTVYKNIPGNRNSINGNTIHIIYEDRGKTLWIGTSQGLNKYNRELDIVVPIPILQADYVSGIFELSDGRLFLTTPAGIILYNPINESKQYFLTGKEIGYLELSGGMVEYTDGKYLINTRHGLYSFNTTDFSYSQVEFQNEYILSSADIRSICKTRDERIWIGTSQNGLFLLNYKDDLEDPWEARNIISESDNPVGLSPGAVEAILEDEHNNLWVAVSPNGINILKFNQQDRNQFLITHLRNNPLMESTISGNTIYEIFQDRDGTVWIGNHNSGLSKYNPKRYKFKRIEYEPNRYSGLMSNQVGAILDEGNILWVGTGGLNRYNRRQDTWEWFVHNETDDRSLGADAIATIFRDSKGQLWAGTWAGGLNLFNENTKTFTRYLNTDNPNSISSNNIFGINEDKEGNLWIATMGGGLNKFDFESKSFISYQHKPDSNSISTNWIKSTIESSDGELWIATGNGLDIFNKSSSLFRHYFHDNSDSTSISSNFILTLFEDSRKNMWVGTENGLNLYNPKDSGFFYFTEQDGLPNNVIRGILEDDGGNLWISTNKGLSKFIQGVYRELDSGSRFKNYTINDGLLSNEFNSRSCAKGKDGYLYFGGKGINYFHPDSLIEHTTPPKVILTELLLFNRKVDPAMEDSPIHKHISLCDELTLSYKHSVISFEFAALDFISPENNQYSFFLHGFDIAWHNVGNKREATYTNLDPGKYTFQVIASNSDGYWNEEGASVHITILPPWWKTIWFRSISLLVLIGLLIGFYYYRLNKLNEQRILLTKLVKERTTEIEEKNLLLLKQADDLFEANTEMEERQQKVEEQAEELRAQAEELFKSNTALVTLDATKDKFFSIIAHDLKNPFSSILGFCEILLSRYDKYEDQKRKHLISLIDQSAQNLYKLLENLLQWARSQTGSITFSPDKINLNELIENIMLVVENSLKEKNLKFSHNIPFDLILFADRNMIHTVIRNLLTNAIKFSEEGEIKIEVEQKNKLTKISIVDNGIGIAEKVQEKIFDIDKSKSTEGTRGESGTGLGLIICKEFIVTHGGDIGVTSVLGKGSTFFFTIPKKSD